MSASVYAAGHDPGRAYTPLVGVSRGDIAGDLGTLVEISANCYVGRRRAGAIGLLKSAVAAVEARHDLPPPIAAGGLGVEQGLHLIAPLLTLVGPADRAQIMERAHDFAEALQIVVKRRRRVALPMRGQAETKQHGTDGEKSFHAIARDPRGDGMRRLDGNRKADHRAASSVAAVVTISARPSVVR